MLARLVPVAAVALIGSLLLGLAAAPSVRAADRPFEGLELSLLIHSTVYRAIGGDDPDGVVADFERRTGAKVNVITAASGGAIWERAVLEWVSRTGRYDLITFNTPFLHRGIVPFIEPLDGYIANAGADYDFEDIIQATVDPARFDGKTYALPMRMGGGFFYFRQDLLDEAGLSVPRTLDEMVSAAHALTRDVDGDGRTDIWGLLVRSSEPQASTNDFQRILYMNGGRFFSEDQSRLLFGDEKTVEVERIYVDLLRSGALPPDITAIGRDEQIGLVQQGRVGMTIAYSAYYTDFVNPAQSRLPEGALSWALPPTAPGVPHGRSDVAGWYLVIDKNSRKKEAAWELMKAITNRENQLKAALRFGNAPVRHSTYNNPDFLSEIPPAADWAKAYAVSLSEAHERWAEIETIVHEEHGHALLGRKSPEDAVAAMVRRIQQIF